MFKLIQDDDSHWYICPDDRVNEALAYFEAVDKYWKKQHDYYGESYNGPAEIDYIIRIDGPGDVKFSDYVLED